MPGDKISISFTCKRCATSIVWPNDATDSTEISCSNCGGHVGTYADLKKTAMDAARDRVETLIKDTFKRW